MRWTAGDQVAERLLAVELVAELLLAMLRLHFVVATRLPERVHCLLGVHDEPIGPELIIADLGPTFRDLSIGTLALCALFDCLGAASGRSIRRSCLMET